MLKSSSYDFPVSESRFNDLVKKGKDGQYRYCFVDKTDYIREIINNERRILLPRKSVV